MAVLICFAAALSALETMLPPICPIAGVRVGLGNTVMLFMLYVSGTKNRIFRDISFSGTDVLTAAILKCFLSALITGSVSSAIFGLTGGMLAVGAMLAAKILLDSGDKKDSRAMLPFVGIIGAIFHIAGQLIAAVILYRTMSVLAYTPILLASAVVGGAFTGICAKLILKVIH